MVEVFYNTTITSPHGLTVPVIGGQTTDAEILTAFIGKFFWWEIAVWFIVLFLLFAKIIIDRRIKRDPSFKERTKTLYMMLESAYETLFIMIIVINIGLWIYRLTTW